MTFMLNGIKLLSVVLSTAFFVGCNSLNYHAEHWNEPMAYPGLRLDSAGLVEAHSAGPMYTPIIFSYSLIDMPFSFIADTLYFPNDIYEIEHNKYKERHPSTNNVASQIQTNLLWRPTMSPKQLQQWNMLPGP
jgi:uncharacterized protein YceK